MSNRPLIHHDAILCSLSVNKELFEILVHYTGGAGALYLAEVWDGHEAVFHTFEADEVTEAMRVRVSVAENPDVIQVEEFVRELHGNLLEWKSVRTYTWGDDDALVSEEINA